MFSALVAMKSAVIIVTLYFFGGTGEVEEFLNCCEVKINLKKADNMFLVL